MSAPRPPITADTIDLITIVTDIALKPDPTTTYNLMAAIIGHPLLSHEFPRALTICADHLRATDPELATLHPPTGHNPDDPDEDQVRTWADHHLNHLGPTRTITPLPPDTWQPLDPIALTDFINHLNRDTP